MASPHSVQSHSPWLSLLLPFVVIDLATLALPVHAEFTFQQNQMLTADSVTAANLDASELLLSCSRMPTDWSTKPRKKKENPSEIESLSSEEAIMLEKTDEAGSIARVTGSGE
jgi:hypothetical protein